MSSDKLKKGHSLSKAQAQLDRFKRTARELGCDETGAAFEQAFQRIIPKPLKRPRTGAPIDKKG